MVKIRRYKLLCDQYTSHLRKKVSSHEKWKNKEDFNVFSENTWKKGKV
jgi:hypothetical protein